MADKTYIFVGAMNEIAGAGGVWRKEHTMPEDGRDLISIVCVAA